MLNRSPLLPGHRRVFQVSSDVDLMTPAFRLKLTRGSSRLPFIFYCLGSLDLLDTLGTAVKEIERESWRNDIWGLHVGTAIFYHIFSHPQCGPRWNLGERFQAQLVHDGFRRGK